MSRSKFFAGLAVVFVCGVNVQAAPTVNGTVGAGEYETIIQDSADTSKEFYGTGLDIDTMQFDADQTGNVDDSYYLSITTVNTPIDTNGSPGSINMVTSLQMAFGGSANPDASNADYILNIVVEDAGSDVKLWEWDNSGSIWSEVSLGGTDYAMGVGDHFEFSILKTKMPNMPVDPYFNAILDGSGGWQDDQVAGKVPEPATMALLGMGGIGILIRRRRKA